MRILVTDSDTRSALAAVRSLGARGHTVYTAGRSGQSLASVSRHAQRHFPCPDPMRDIEAFAPAVADICRQAQVELLLPMTEVTTLLLAEHQHLLPPGCAFPFPDAGKVALAADKGRVIDLARTLGVPVPAGTVAGSAAEAIAAAPDLPLPVVVKPTRSRIRIADRWISTGVRYAASAGELREIVTALPAAAFPVLLQERIHGEGAGIFACMDERGAVALFAHRRIREKPPSGGVSVLCESVPIDAAAGDYGVRLLAAMGWRGVAMVEFKRDNRDGGLRLMEINGRFWGSLQLAIDAGVDFPGIVADLAQGARPAVAPRYRTRVRSRWLAGDLDALLMQLFKSRGKLKLPAGHPGRLRALWQFLHLWGGGMRYEIERPDDLAPALLQWKRRLFSR